MNTVSSRAVRARHRGRPWLALIVGIALIVGPGGSLNLFATGMDLARNDNVSRATKTRQTLTSVVESMQTIDPDVLGADRVAALAAAHEQIGQMTDAELEEIDEQLGPQLEQMNAALDALRAIDPGGENRIPSINDPFPTAAYPTSTTSVTVAGGTDLDTGSCENRCGDSTAIITPCTGSGQGTCASGQFCITDICYNVTTLTCSVDDDCGAGSPCIGSGSCGPPPAQPTQGNLEMAATFSCNRTERSTVEEATGALAAFIAVEAVRDVASRVCNQEYGTFFVQFNLSVVCIIADVAYLIGKNLYVNLDLCDRFINSAEIAATYDRLEHLKDDIDLHDANIKGELTAATAAVNARTADAEMLLQDKIETHDGDIEDQLALHDANIKTDLTNHDTDIKALLAATRAFKLRLEIEEALYRNERDAIYYLPEPAGNAALARTIVVETMARVTASGESVYYAQGKLNSSDTEAGRGNHKRAFYFLSQAYFEAIKLIGERQ